MLLKSHHVHPSASVSLLCLKSTAALHCIWIQSRTLYMVYKIPQELACISLSRPITLSLSTLFSLFLLFGGSSNFRTSPFLLLLALVNYLLKNCSPVSAVVIIVEFCKMLLLGETRWSVYWISVLLFYICVCISNFPNRISI